VLDLQGIDKRQDSRFIARTYAQYRRSAVPVEHMRGSDAVAKRNALNKR
jgi:hypothetical protein